MNTAERYQFEAFVEAVDVYGERKIPMFNETEQRSEVACLLARISAEYQAAQHGLSGLSSGGARHDFISARTENIGKCHEELIELVGQEQAISIIAQTIWSPTDQRVVP